jgi:hypothetical protein
MNVVAKNLTGGLANGHTAKSCAARLASPDVVLPDDSPY